jgi:hypothetical protein
MAHLAKLFTVLLLQACAHSAAGQLDPKSPQCAKGYAISQVQIPTIQVSGGTSTVVTSLTYTPQAGTLSGQTIQVCGVTAQFTCYIYML